MRLTPLSPAPAAPAAPRSPVGSWRAAAIAALACVAATATTAAALPSGALPVATYEAWTNHGDEWTSESGYAHGNDDSTPDVVVASGARPYGYTWVAGGNPTTLARGFTKANYVGGDTAELRLLDGRTGEPLWTHVWAQGRTAPTGPASPIHVVEGILAGSLDSVPGDDVLVLRQTYTPTADGSVETDEYTTLHDAQTGAVRWEQRTPGQGDVSTSRTLVPVTTGERTLGVVSRYAYDQSAETSELDVQVVEVVPQALSVVAELPTRQNVFGFVDVAPTAQGLVVLSSAFRILVGNDVDEDGVLTATQVQLGAPAQVSELWSRPGMASANSHLTGGRLPSAVVIRPNGTFALDIATGAQRWRHEVAGSPFDSTGSIGESDINGDGVHDVVVSPVVGETLYRQDFTTELYALEGERGLTMWHQLEPTGKFGARAYTTLDIDGDGRLELAAASLQHDGFFAGLFDDDPAQITVYDLGDGDRRCQFPVDRLPSRLDPVALPGFMGQQLLSVGLSGVTTVRGYAYPLCDAAS